MIGGWSELCKWKKRSVAPPQPSTRRTVKIRLSQNANPLISHHCENVPARDFPNLRALPRQPFQPQPKKIHRPAQHRCSRSQHQQPDQRAALLSKLEANPPFFFEHPDLDPESDLVPKYLADLAALQVRVSPRDSHLDELISDVAEYLRQDPKVILKRLGLI